MNSPNSDSNQKYQIEIDRLKGELKQTRQTIVEKDKFLDGLTHCFEGVLFLYNIALGQFIFVGENIEQIYGYTKDELNQMQGGMFALIYEDDLPNVMGVMAKMAEIGPSEKFKLEYRIKRKDGQIVWTAIWATPHSYTSEGAVETMSGVKLDTSALKAVETENVVFDNMIEAMFAQEEVGISISNAKGKWTRVSKQFAKMLGYEVRELIDLTYSKITSEEHLGQDHKDFKLIMSGEKDVYDVEKEYIKKDGSKLWVGIHGFSIRNIDGKPEYLLSMISDISKDVEHLKRVEESENRFKNIVESSRTWFWEVDLKGHIVYLSKNHESLTGYGINELIGTSVVETRVESQKEGFREMLISLRENPTVFVDLAGQYNCKDARIMDIISSGIPEFNENGEVFCYRGSTTDISDRRSAEREAEKYMADLKSSNRELEQFAYAASHDLQEPVRLMSTYTQLLKENIGADLDEGNLRIMHHIVNSSRRMRDLINGLMEFSRVGKQELHLEKVNCTSIINDVVDDFCQKIQESSAEVAIGELPEVLCDPLLVNIVFHNLLCNSIKFSKSDVPIKVEFAAKVYDQVAEFTVTDNGIGIKEEYLDVIFKIFKRLNS
ncbi:MAG: PAS domain S-box-containing protein, partial [Flavobacteriales bacterium]